MGHADEPVRSERIQRRTALRFAAECSSGAFRLGRWRSLNDCNRAV